MEQQFAQFQSVYNQIALFLVNYSFQILGAVFILLLGLVLARKVGGWVEELMLKHAMDATLSRFTASAVKTIVMIMVGIIALGKLGVSVAPFVAAIGAVSLGAGLALQGMLSNYGAGVVIVVTRPFVVGDRITVKHVTGVVRVVRLGSTMITNEDGVQITIPNHHIIGEILQNSRSETIVEMNLDIAYGSDPLRAVELIRSVIVSQSNVSKTHAPQVGIHDFGANGYTLALRYWTETERLSQTRFQINAAIHNILREHVIALAVPQRDVRMVQVPGQ